MRVYSSRSGTQFGVDGKTQHVLFKAIFELTLKKLHENSGGPVQAKQPHTEVHTCTCTYSTSGQLEWYLQSLERESLQVDSVDVPVSGDIIYICMVNTCTLYVHTCTFILQSPKTHVLLS